MQNKPSIKSKVSTCRILHHCTGMPKPGSSPAHVTVSIINKGGRRSPGAVCPRNAPQRLRSPCPRVPPHQRSEGNRDRDSWPQGHNPRPVGLARHKTPGVFTKIFTRSIIPGGRPPACRHGQERAPTPCLSGQTGLPTYNYCPAKKAAHSSKTGRKSVATTSA